jgi:hypothetical protein
LSLGEEKRDRPDRGRVNAGAEKRVISDQISAIRKKEKAYAEITEDAEFAEKNGKSRSLHCVPQNARHSGRDDNFEWVSGPPDDKWWVGLGSQKRRARKNRAASLGMTK